MLAPTPTEAVAEDEAYFTRCAPMTQALNVPFNVRECHMAPCVYGKSWAFPEFQALLEAPLLSPN